MASNISLSYDSSRGTATAVLSDGGTTATITAAPKSGYYLSKIVQQCDVGNNHTWNYNNVSTEQTVVSAGHTACSQISVTVLFVSQGEVFCEYFADASSWPRNTAIVAPAASVKYVSPGVRPSFSFRATPNKGWQIDSYDWGVIIFDTESYEYHTDYSRPQTGTVSINLTPRHQNDHSAGRDHELYLIVNTSRRVFTLTFNANGGSVSPATKSVSYGLAYGTLPVPVRAGWIFLGWFTAQVGGDKVSSADIYEKVGDSTVYAHWIEAGSILYSTTNDKILYGSNDKILYLDDPSQSQGSS